MQKKFCFDNILIPVDFSVNTEVAVAKAIKLIEGPGCHLHLIYVRKHDWKALFFPHSAINHNITVSSATRALDEWKSAIEDHRPEIKVSTTILQGNTVQEAIAAKAIDINSSLIIVGKHSNHSWLPFLNTIVPGKLSALTNIPVLTVKPGSHHQETRTVVLPIGFNSVNKKLDMMLALSKKFRMRVHLVALVEQDPESMDSLASYFLETFSWLKSNLHCPVEYNFLKGNNKAKALVDFCERVNADLLLVYPLSETRAGWLDAHISDLLPATSKTQVLTV